MQSTLTQHYLGPASVIAVVGDLVMLATPVGEFKAELALAFPYRPAQGDTVLTIGEEGNAWVIGVIRGAGVTEFCVPGNMRIEAGGRISISGGRGLVLRAPRMELRADRLEITAQAIMERSLRCYRWAKSAMQVSAGRLRTLVQGQATLHARRIVQQAEKDVLVDGERINLG